MLGYHDVRPSGFQTCPASSCSMKRPTRVPASIVVRMNSASNMIAKWYQSARPRPAERRRAKMLRHADGERRRAAGARQQRRFAHLRRERLHLLGRDREAPFGDLARRRLARAAERRRATFIAKYTPGSSIAAAIIAMTADERFHQHRAVADEHARRSRASIIFGVVPLAISAWKPEIAPHAIVMNPNGNSLPGEHRAGAVDELRDRRHLAAAAAG